MKNKTVNKAGKIKGIIFDMDGVLVDSLQLHFQAGDHALKPYGLKWEKEDSEYIQGMTGSEMYTYMVKKYNLPVHPDELTERQAKAYLEKAQQELGTFPNAGEMLGQLHKKYKIALATGANWKMVDLAFARFGWKKYFNAVITVHDVKWGKPHPESYLKAIQGLKLKPNECIVVEDALKGIESGKLAGAHVIAVTHSFPEEQIAAYKIKPDKIAHNLKEVMEKIKEIEKDNA